MILSNKAKNISPSLTLAITAKAKQMKKDGFDVVGFGAGEPDFDTPENIQNAAIEAIKKGYTRYTPASGIEELKKAIVKKFNDENDLTYSTNQIIISTGAKQCLANVFQAILNSGDEVLISNPYWVSYPELVKIADGVPVFVENNADSDFKYSVETLEKYITEKSKVLLINSPNNPTGAVYTKEELLSIAEFAKKHDLIIVSDEIYEKLIYGNEKHISIASLSEDSYNRTIVINGVSKSYAMTGWRIGYAAANKEIIKLMSSIQSHTTSNPNSIAQYAALEAITGNQDPVADMVKAFSDRKDYMVKRINEIESLSCANADGAFYIMLCISELKGRKVDGELITDSLKFSNLLLEKQNVAVVPGIAFGCDDYVRLSYATSVENITEGLRRIEQFVLNLE